MTEKLLVERLKNATRLVVVGVGNELNGDDAAGVELVRRLRKRGHLSRRVRVIDAGVAPENFTNVIREFHPSHILIVDSAQLGSAPGSTRIIGKKEITGLGFSTHVLPLSFTVDYFEKELNAEVIVIGIQPLKAGFGKGISGPVMDCVSMLEEVLGRILHMIR